MLIVKGKKYFPGATLLLLTLLIVTYALCTCCGPSCSCRRIRGSGSEKESAYYSSPASLASSSNNNYKSYKSSEGVGKTLCALGCAFVCGGLGVIFLLVRFFFQFVWENVVAAKCIL